MPPAAASVQRPAQAASPAVPGRVLAGAIRGNIVTGTATKRFHGPQILGGTLLLTIVGAPVLAAQGQAHRVQTWLGATEIYAVTVLIALLALGRNRHSVVGAMAYSGRAFLPRRRAKNAVPGQDPGSRRAPAHATEVSRFRVEALTGQSHTCALSGELVGGRLKDGDYVHVTSRRSRSAELKAREVVVLSSANGVPLARIVPARRGDYAVARRTDRIALGLAAALVLGLAVGVVLVLSA